jgi:phage/plasmid-associated DNA primase
MVLENNTNMEANNMVDFFRGYYSESGSHYTHVSQHTPRGRFNLSSRNTMEKFWDIYCRNVNNSTNKFISGLAEKPSETGIIPVLVDIDISAPISDERLILNENNKLYTEQNVKDIVNIYNSVLKTILIDCDDDKLYCVVLEKNPYEYKKDDFSTIRLKSGFHLHYPYIFFKKEDQQNQLVPRVQSLLRERNVFHNLEYIINDSASFLDSNVIGNSWLLYGSTKEANMEPYKVSYILNSDLQTVTFEIAFNNYNIYDVVGNIIDLQEEGIKYYLPRILSIIPYGRESMEINDFLKTPSLPPSSIRRDNVDATSQPIDLDNAYQEAVFLLNMMNEQRAFDHNGRMHVGWALYSIFSGSDDGLNLWDMFCRKSPEKYNADKCINEWSKMKSGNKTMGTLHHYAKLDNENAYIEFKKQRSKRIFETMSIDGTHYSIAQLLYEEYKHSYVCTNFVSDRWYRFVNGRWKLEASCVSLRRKISEEIPLKFEAYKKHVLDEAALSGSEIIKKNAKSIAEFCDKIIKNLKNRPFKVNVMKEAGDLFYDDDFEEKLDSNPFLFSFKNGVYDLKSNIFRAGLPDDFLSKVAPVNYRKFNMNNDYDKVAIDTVNLFFMKVFPDNELREYFLDQSSYIFIGGNPLKTVEFWLGEGHNGKSITQLIFEKMLGPYSIKISTTAFTGKKGQIGSANPELSRCGGGVRRMVSQEPNADEEMNTGPMKELSGADTLITRDLFQKGSEMKEITPMFKMTFIMNSLLKIKDADSAFWYRTRVIPFESEFVMPGSLEQEPAPDTFEEQIKQKRFPADIDFISKISSFIEPFAWMLLERWRNNQEKLKELRGVTELGEGDNFILPLKPPEKVLIATLMYKKENDIFARFISDYVVKTNKSSDKLLFKGLYETFATWYKDEGLNMREISSRTHANTQFIRLLGEISGGGTGWKGYRYKNLSDEEDKENEIIEDEDDMYMD